MLTFRPATASDLDPIASIYAAIHDAEEAGLLSTGWQRDVYPTRMTARAALDANDLFVAVDDGVIVASARINREQVDVYRRVDWRFAARDDEVMVLHTLTVRPDLLRRGIGSAFEHFYEEEARRAGCRVLRIDTNARNAAARSLYARLGYREAEIVPCTFNGIEGVKLVCLEKEL